MSAIYEVDFLGFSYGFRPGRSQHHALDALATGLERKKVNWVLDADIRGFFDAIDRDWLIKMVEHRIADKRVVRLLQQWLHAGVVEADQHIESETGTAQGAAISPLLANVYLHYALDLWAQQWRTRQARGDMIIVRYADDCAPRRRRRRPTGRRKQPCCMRDEGRSLGVGVQARAPNHRLLLGHNGPGSERARKRRARLVRYEPGRRTRVNR